MSATSIPEASRALVRARARHRCERCATPAPNGHFHHRRSRSVRDAHTHCTCNGVHLCQTCHVWVHANPFEARSSGWIVSRYVTAPVTEPFQGPGQWFLPSCNSAGLTVFNR